ncbi:MAG: VCBS domain-containing protein [Ramlibacter sp.]|uniref:beta strand repeat-containing protein n=1 Tax=Ramlibacter sp. TaxID=1917967 RepID=UPI002634D14A|nr:VCBS domain-containing protein [Ramlibacter sp.]MDH4375011.1 VCBS domain-containing protein [Ramlibacter sp.]
MTTITSGPTGTDGSDLIFAGGGNDSINSGAGNDIIFSGGGNDTINAGAGNDIVFAGSGNDTIDGGSGRDIIFAGAGNDTIDGGLGSDTIDAGAGNDTLIYTYANEARVVDYYNGGSGSDTLVLDFSKYTQWTQASWSSFEATLAQRIAQFKAMVDQYKAANGNLPNSGSKDFVFDFGNGAKLQVAMTEKVVVIAPVLTTLNHAPVITSGPQADAVQEDGTLVVGGMVTATDANTGDVLTYSGNATGVYGSFSVAANGKWTYTLANGNNGTASKVQSLAEGEIQTETFTVTVSDGKGGTATQSVAITITGTNDAPVITSDVQAGAVKEDGTLVVSGTVTATDIDIDNNAALTYSGDATGVYGSFSVAANGVWTYTLDNGTNGTVSKVQSLAEGEIQTEIFTVTVSDGKGGTATQDVTITITGTNDAPVVKGTVSNSADEDAKPVPLDALAGASDVDNDTELQVINVPQTLPAGVTYDADTHMFTLDPRHPEYQTLGEGVKTTVVVNYGISDGLTTTSNSVQWVVTGTNDAPQVVRAVTGSATEDGAVSTLDAFVNIEDVDTDDVLTVVFSAGGTSSDPATVVAMPAGLEGQITTLNDASPTTSDLTTGLTPGGAGGDPNVYAFDPKNPPPGITYDEATHSFSLDPSNKAFQSLGEGETRTVTISYFVSDGKSTIPATLQWVVTGTNDVPIVLARDGDSASADLTEGNSGLTASGSLSLIDPDVTDTVGARVIGVTAVTAYTGALPSTATLLDFFTATSTDTSTTVPTNLRWEFDSKTEAFDFLSQGQELVLTYTVEVNDKQGGTATQDVTVTITGTNDAPTLSAGTQSATLVEAGGVNNGTVGNASATIALTRGDVDGTANFDGAYLLTNGWGTTNGGVTYTKAGTYGTASLDSSAGVVTYTLDNTKAATQGLVTNQSVNDSFTVQVTDGTATASTEANFAITGANDTAVIGTPSVSSVTEDVAVVSGKLTASGSIDIADTDAGEASFKTVVMSSVGNLGTLVLQASGAYVYQVDNSATQFLGSGQTKTDNFIVESLGGTTKQVFFTINGTKDALTTPVFTGANWTSQSTLPGGTTSPTIGTVTVTPTDADSQPLTWQVTATKKIGISNVLSAPSEISHFSIDSAGVLSSSTTLDPAALYTLILTASDSSSSVSKTLGIRTGTNGSNSLTIFPSGSVPIDHLIYTLGADEGSFDNISSGPGNDTVFGQSGSDVILGQGGRDVLYGGPGSDALVGGTEDDYLYGGAESDTLTGGTGDDRFYFDTTPTNQTTDYILDFTIGADKIWLSSSTFGALEDDLGTPFNQLLTNEFASITSLSATYLSSANIVALLRTDGRVDLYYDTDGGNLSTGATLLAALQFAGGSSTTLSASDFFVY